MADGNGGPPAEAWSADRFREAFTRVVPLPRSGAVVRTRPVRAADLAAGGELPEPLTVHIFHDLPELRAKVETPEEGRRLELEKVDAINAVVAAFVAEPRLVPAGQTPGEGELCVTELEWFDRVYLFNVACGAVEAGLERFHDQPAGDVPPAPDGGDVRAKAVRAPRARRR